MYVSSNYYICVLILLYLSAHSCLILLTRTASRPSSLLRSCLLFCIFFIVYLFFCIFFIVYQAARRAATSCLVSLAALLALARGSRASLRCSRWPPPPACTTASCASLATSVSLAQPFSSRSRRSSQARCFTAALLLLYFCFTCPGARGAPRRYVYRLRRYLGAVKAL
jgi:hypothetical protein